MRIAIRLVQALILLLLAALLVGAWYLLPGEQLRPPMLTGVSEDSSLRAGGLRRGYVLYVPPNLAPNPALLVVLHASRSNGQMMRRDSGFGFDALLAQLPLAEYACGRVHRVGAEEMRARLRERA